MTPPLLTIYIPTFNRPEIEQCLASILPVPEDVVVVVSDNSPTRLAAPYVAQYPEVFYQPLRYNIGGDPNILRATTLDTEYLWVVGDDDVILPDTIPLVLDAMKSNPDRIVLTTHDAPLPDFSGTMADWITSLHNTPTLSHLIASTLITSNIYKSAALDPMLGLEKIDTHYPLTWSALPCNTVTTISTPAFICGITPSVDGGVFMDAHDIWQEYLDALTAYHEISYIQLPDCLYYNFANARRKAEKVRV